METLPIAVCLACGTRVSLRCGRRSGYSALVEFMKMLNTATPEQVIAVPKISPDRIPQRFVNRRRPQRAEQLVEVPTVVSLSSDR